MQDPILRELELEYEMKQNEDKLAVLAVKAAQAGIMWPYYKAQWKTLLMKILAQEEELAKIRAEVDNLYSAMEAEFNDLSQFA